MTIPVTVLGGYLGAGKTTLLNHLLRTAEGRRYAVLVNDFGELNIDTDLVISNDGDTVELANGCICCSLAGGFAEAMFRIRERAPQPDHLVVEASGVADPAAVAQYAHLDGFALDGVVVLADAEQVRARAKDRYVGRHVVAQLRHADLIVLNKTDLVDTDRLAGVRAWMEATAPGRPVVAAERAEVASELLLGLDHQLGEPSDGHPQHESWTWTSDSPVERHWFETVLHDLPAELVRAKGFVHFTHSPDDAFVVQVVGSRVSLSPGGPSGPSRLVFIGLPGHDLADRLSARFQELS